MAIAGNKCFAETEKALNSWAEAVDRNRVLTEGNMLRRKARSLSESSSNGAPETSEAKLGTASKGQLPRCRDKFELKNGRISREAVLMKKLLLRFWQS